MSENAPQSPCNSLLKIEPFVLGHRIPPDDSSDEEEKRSIVEIEFLSPPRITWKHSWPLSQTRDALSDSPFVNIPTEILIEIFRLLSVRDLGNVSLVCRFFKTIVDQDEIWKLKYEKSYKLRSKSLKEIHMEWIYEQYLRVQERQKIERIDKYGYICITSTAASDRPPHLPQYPVRSTDKVHFSSVDGFHEHPNSSQYMTIPLSCNHIERTARELISLLEKVSTLRFTWCQPAIVKQMITRYYRFMQLKASSPSNLLLVPTLDIEIIWQTHLLRPKMYRNDCLRLFHRVIDHSLLTDDIEQFVKQQAFIDTCQFYEEQFGEQYCPLPVMQEKRETAPRYGCSPSGCIQCLIPVYSYWDGTHFDFAQESSSDYENPFSFTETDVILDSNWLDLCKSFMSETLSTVGIHQDQDNPAREIDLSFSPITLLTKSYERFLYMNAKYPPIHGHTFVHPTYAIEIIWHSHMQEPLNYAADCIRFVGYVIDHIPLLSNETDLLKEPCENINDIWKEEFDNDIITDHLYKTIISMFV